MEGDHIYIAIDLKSFYASVECVERKFDPLSTNLVVADPSRTEKTICLAVTPSLKAYGISGRARLFEVVQRVKEVNAERLARAIREGKAQRDEKGNFCFVTSSFDAKALAEDPSLELGYFVAPPRMKLYEQYSAKIFSIYTKYISPEDIVVYSIDEIFAEGEKQNIRPKDDEERQKTIENIRLIVKGLVARDLWDMSEYFAIIYENDDVVKKAVELLSQQ